jgi:uncharacterized protein
VEQVSPAREARHAQGRWALVTGASGGIGAEIARELSARGWNLILTARSKGALEALAREVRARDGILAQVVPVDLADPSGPGALEAATEGSGLCVDLLVNNAGFGDFGPFLDAGLDRGMGMVQVNVAALTELSWRFAAAMARRGRGRILNVASTAAFQPGPGMAVYYATKAYVLSLSEGLRVEFRDAGISVTTLCPGPTATGFQELAGMGNSGLLTLLPVPGAREVARFGVAATLKGKGVAIHGWVNRLLVLGVRLIPRRILPDLVYRIQRSRV